MGGYLAQLSTIALAFFAIMNPIANTPIFLALTEGEPTAVRRHIALRALGLAFLIIAAFAYGGQALFHAFGITLAALRIAGGVIVAIVGYHLLQGEPSVIHTPPSAKAGSTAESDLGIAITPLALPILAGPGTIATAMSYSGGGSWATATLVTAAFALVCLLTLLCFLSGEKLVHYLGRTAIKVVTRLMGLILAVIGTQMLMNGITGAVTDFRTHHGAEVVPLHSIVRMS